MKPVGRAQGKGIFLFTKLSQINDWKKDSKWRPNSGGVAGGDAEQEQVEMYVAQRYIDNPLLIGGKKFDMRLYALVTCFSPLTVWIYRSGFARFSNFRFSMKKKDVSNSYIHLTNVAVQKTAPEYAEKAAAVGDGTSALAPPHSLAAQTQAGVCPQLSSRLSSASAALSPPLTRDALGSRRPATTRLTSRRARFM